MKKALIITSAALVIIGSFALGILSNPGSKIAPPATAQWAPEALQLVDQIKTAGTNWQTGQTDLVAATEAVKKANEKITRAEAAAKGADLTLCATFQARYDRATDKIVSDANCPLL